MAAVETSQPVLLVKKLGAMLLLIAGTISTAFGFYAQYYGLKVAGFALLAIAILLLVLKIARRNQASP